MPIDFCACWAGHPPTCRPSACSRLSALETMHPLMRAAAKIASRLGHRGSWSRVPEAGGVHAGMCLGPEPPGHAGGGSVVLGRGREASRRSTAVTSPEAAMSPACTASSRRRFLVITAANALVVVVMVASGAEREVRVSRRYGTPTTSGGPTPIPWRSAFPAAGCISPSSPAGRHLPGRPLQRLPSLRRCGGRPAMAGTDQVIDSAPA
jgi:hypothetical protein